MTGHLRVVGDAPEPLPYPVEDVTNALVELDATEDAVLTEARTATARASTADRLAAAYIAAVDVFGTGSRGVAYGEWLTASDAAARELQEAEEAYREVWKP